MDRSPGHQAEGEHLADYRAKRDPARSIEPFGAERILSGSGTRRGRFVVHHHAARRDHFDLRLEVGKRLESFAVPKGPSLDPGQKRLAVHTESHPLEYLEFEDVIPAGGYGAGPMIAWDAGLVQYHEQPAEDGLERGKVDFDLFGYKLRGRFALIATGRRKAGRGSAEWLLVKKQDASARAGSEITSEQPFSVLSGLTVTQLIDRQRIADEIRARALSAGAVPDTAQHLLPLRAGFEPMLCATEPVTLEAPDYLYELKIDGARILAAKDGDRVSLRFRHGRPCTDRFPEIVRAVRSLAPRRLVLDGEITSFDEQGRPSFQRLSPRLHGQSAARLHRGIVDPPVTFLVFDLLALEDVALLDLPLLTRKELLLRLLPGPGWLRALDHLEGNGQPLWNLCEEHHLEGLVAKRATSKYQPGARTTDWVKIKRESDDDFVVVALVGGRGARKRLGALEVASYEGERLVLRGKVGSGLSEALVDRLLERAAALETAEPAYEGLAPVEPGLRRFLRPQLVVTVRHMGWTDDGRLRFPVFREIREDIEPEACRAAPSEGQEERTFEAALRNQHEQSAVAPGLITNPDKIFWPEERYTKLDLVEYYVTVADALLPLLKGRPTLLVRYPDGIEGKSFFQWNPPRDGSRHVRALMLRDGEHQSKSAFVIDDVDALAYVINLGCIPLHVLSYRESSRDHCDFVTIDFDVGEQPLGSAIRLVRALGEILQDIGLPGFPKTSGQTGLHVLVAPGPGVPFDAAKMLAEILGRLIVARHPELATMERTVSRRGPRVYVDAGQTGRSRAIVAPYSVRAWPGATVSTPLAWNELSLALDPRAFTIRTLPDRLADVGDLATGLLAAKPDLGAAMAKLEALLRQAD